MALPITVTPRPHNDGVIDVGVVREQVGELLRALEPDAVPLPEAVSLWQEFTAIARDATAAATLLARRVDESREWQRAGHRSPAEFLAAQGGNSIDAARVQLEMSEKLEQMPRLEQAVRTGTVSGAKAALIMQGTSANPDAEQRLLEQAERSSLKELHDEVLRVRAAADPDPEATQRRIHARRRVRTWRDPEGGWNLAARGTVSAGARIEAALKPLIEAEFAKARTEERREAREAYAFDALLALAEHDRGGEAASASGPRDTTIVRVDLEALRRGRVHDGEVCEVAGLGPIPVDSAREVLGESILKLVITKGVDVLNVTHLGRGPNAAQRVALLWCSQGCSVEGCARTRVEIDHRIPYAESRHTRLGECDPLCTHHHRRKHTDGWALVDGVGKRAMVPPGDPRHPKNTPRRDSS